MKRLILVPCLVLLSACSLPFGSRDEAPSPTATHVGVALPPTWTPTSEPARPPIARPTSRATAEPTATPEIKVTALRLSEITGGYAPVQPITYGLSPALLGAGVLKPQAIAMFERPDNGAIVLSVAAVLSSPIEEQGFATWITTPTLPLEVLARAFGQLEGSARPLSGYDDLGTASAAAEGVILMRNTRYTAQIILIQQGPAAAYVAVFVPRYSDSGFDLPTVMRLYAQRLGGTPEPEEPPTVASDS